MLKESKLTPKSDKNSQHSPHPGLVHDLKITLDKHMLPHATAACDLEPGVGRGDATCLRAGSQKGTRNRPSGPLNRPNRTRSENKKHLPILFFSGHKKWSPNR